MHQVKQQPAGGKRPIIAVVAPPSPVASGFPVDSQLDPSVGGAAHNKRPVYLVLNDALDQLSEEDFDLSKLVGNFRPDGHDESAIHNDKPQPELKPQVRRISQLKEKKN